MAYPFLDYMRADAYRKTDIWPRLTVLLFAELKPLALGSFHSSSCLFVCLPPVSCLTLRGAYAFSVPTPKPINSFTPNHQNNRDALSPRAHALTICLAGPHLFENPR
jgi:hypothetical protein